MRNTKILLFRTLCGLIKIARVLVFLTCRGESAECFHVTGEHIEKYVEYESIITCICAGKKTKTKHIYPTFLVILLMLSILFFLFPRLLSLNFVPMSGFASRPRIGSLKMRCGEAHESSDCRKLELSCGRSD